MLSITKTSVNKVRVLVLYVLFLAFASSLYQCSDLFDTNLSKKKYSVTLVSPSDSVTTEIQNQTFSWEAVKGAEEYRFQLAYPSFDKAEIIYVDSCVTGTSFAYSFNFSGKYQWRVKAKNQSSETKYSTRTLFINKILNLSKQTLFIYEPLDSLYTANSRTEGRTFIIDRTVPSAPTLLYPKADTIYKDTSSVNMAFKWARPDDDVLYDSIYVLDSSKTSVIFKAKTINEYFNYPCQWTDNKRYWKVISFDKAGNKSAASEVRKFTFAPKS